MSVTAHANAFSGAHIFSICQFNTSWFPLHNCQCAGCFSSNKHSGSYNAISIEFAKTMRRSIPHSTPCSPCGPIKQTIPPTLRVQHSRFASFSQLNFLCCCRGISKDWQGKRIWELLKSKLLVKRSRFLRKCGCVHIEVFAASRLRVLAITTHLSIFDHVFMHVPTRTHDLST